MVFEPASTLLMKKFSPSFWMSRIMISWVSLYLPICRSWQRVMANGSDGRASFQCVRGLLRIIPACCYAGFSWGSQKLAIILEFCMERTSLRISDSFR